MPQPASAEIIALRNTPGQPFNPGIPFDRAPVDAVRVNLSAVERRAVTLPKRRTVKKEWQAAWLVRALTCIDLTTLSGDDTEGRVRRLCAKAWRPLRPDIQAGLGLAGRRISTAAVCIYPRFIAVAREALAGSDIPVAAVSAGFPAGLAPLAVRIADIRDCVAAGADEIDVVITREHVLTGNWQALYDEVRAFKDACGDVHMKTIIATGDLRTLRNVGRASWVAMMAGSDFIKTSTGKEAVNATLPVALVMVRRDPRIPRHDRLHRRLQARRRHLHRQGRHGLRVRHEGRVGQRLAAARSFPHRRVVAPGRYRAPAGALPHRPVRRLRAPRPGLTLPGCRPWTGRRAPHGQAR